MLKGKHIVIGVTGSIAAYKAANLVSMIKKKGADVTVIMTENATNFINPITFETLTGKKCLIDTFDRNFQHNVEHISIAKSADLMMIAPATANVIGKLSAGIADDMLTTVSMAVKCPLILAPAMNTNMYTNPILQENLNRLRKFGYQIVEPATGLLACGDTGAGKMPSEDVLLEHILYEIAFKKDLAGKRILITAGPTQESIDPVRYISNHSTGKMGYALATIASYRGADVTLISGKSHLTPPYFVSYVPVISAEDMFNAVSEHMSDADIIIKSAAVADYTPLSVASEKIKKKDGDNTLYLKRTKDILAHLGQHRKKDQFICGFSMETENMIENSITKLKKKNADMIIANNLKDDGAGFAVDSNRVVLITKDSQKELPIMDKKELSSVIFDEILLKLQTKA